MKNFLKILIIFFAFIFYTVSLAQDHVFTSRLGFTFDLSKDWIQSPEEPEGTIFNKALGTLVEEEIQDEVFFINDTLSGSPSAWLLINHLDMNKYPYSSLGGASAMQIFYSDIVCYRKDKNILDSIRSGVGFAIKEYNGSAEGSTFIPPFPPNPIIYFDEANKILYRFSETDAMKGIAAVMLGGDAVPVLHFYDTHKNFDTNVLKFAETLRTFYYTR